MPKSPLSFAILCVISFFSFGLGVAEAQTPASQEVERHCITQLSARSSKHVAPITCFATEAAVDSVLVGTSAMRSSSNVIGRHYTSKNFGGSSITIVGTTCGGGHWYPTGFWNNNIESSLHYCGGVLTRFFDSVACSGAGLSISSASSNLFSMNNKASCVQYG